MLLDVSYDYPGCVAVPVFSRNQRYRNQKRKEREKQKWGEGNKAVKASVFNFRRKKENLEAVG